MLLLSEHRQEKIDVKLINYINYVFGQIRNRYVIGWFDCRD